MGSMTLKNGGADFLDLFDVLPRRLVTNVVRGGVRASEAVYRDEMRVRAAKVSGEFAAGIKSRSPRRNGDIVIGGVGLKGDHAYVGLFLEKGVGSHKIVMKKKGGLSLGNDIVRAQVNHPGFGPSPFMAPAFDTKTEEAINAFGSYVSSRITWGALKAPEIQVAEVDAGEEE